MWLFTWMGSKGSVGLAVKERVEEWVRNLDPFCCVSEWGEGAKKRCRHCMCFSYASTGFIMLSMFLLHASFPKAPHPNTTKDNLHTYNANQYLNSMFMTAQHFTVVMIGLVLVEEWMWREKVRCVICFGGVEWKVWMMGIDELWVEEGHEWGQGGRGSGSCDDEREEKMVLVCLNDFWGLGSVGWWCIYWEFETQHVHCSENTSPSPIINAIIFYYTSPFAIIFHKHLTQHASCAMFSFPPSSSSSLLLLDNNIFKLHTSFFIIDTIQASHISLSLTNTFTLYVSLQQFHYVHTIIENYNTNTLILFFV